MHFGTSSAQEKGGSDEEKMQNSQLEKFKLKVLELSFFKPQVNCGEASMPSFRTKNAGDGDDAMQSQPALWAAAAG